MKDFVIIANRAKYIDAYAGRELNSYIELGDLADGNEFAKVNSRKSVLQFSNFIYCIVPTTDNLSIVDNTPRATIGADLNTGMWPCPRIRHCAKTDEQTAVTVNSLQSAGLANQLVK